MNITLLSGSTIGSKTRTAMNYTKDIIERNYPEHEVTLLDLADFELVFSDGRDFREYKGDTKVVTETIMESDIILIGTPIFQASIPGSLKNVFDLLPQDGLRDKTAGILVTAGSAKHYLIAETQLKPILAYMKAQIVQTYTFMEERDFYRKEIVNEDAVFRIERLVEDTMVLAETYKEARRIKEEQYGF
ncbi:NADPH-dependent FMN reductase [Alkalibacterium pelagium]|uniref:FMN reductase n=1 Tax=Alkalibacterium pelagium TaxID=426702 RepID=A0A1H7IZ47_9LACT|nr:NADPH-dependent FMN reductase [Alkalibacterium pelagium]GEN50313.1 FMN reductase [Alkalibacterium pelagium]SEK66907.1 FMN reductase [Alkalibacterium pelagium]